MLLLSNNIYILSAYWSAGLELPMVTMESGDLSLDKSRVEEVEEKPSELGGHPIQVRSGTQPTAVIGP